MDIYKGFEGAIEFLKQTTVESYRLREELQEWDKAPQYPNSNDNVAETLNYYG